MKKNIDFLLSVLLLIGCFSVFQVTNVSGQTFVHPGGLHNIADLERMKNKVAAGEHPWIDAWNVLITAPEAQNTYTAGPSANMAAGPVSVPPGMPMQLT